jgi:hypothetical protein
MFVQPDIASVTRADVGGIGHDRAEAVVIVSPCIRVSLKTPDSRLVGARVSCAIDKVDLHWAVSMSIRALLHA